MQPKPSPELEIMDPVLKALLGSSRVLPSLPSRTRTRALARARAFVAATSAVSLARRNS